MSMEEQMPAKPEWLDDDFIKQCIKNDTGVSEDEIVVNDAKLHYAIPKGENYTSLILRLAVKVDINSAPSKLTNGSNEHRNGFDNKQLDKKDITYIVKALMKQGSMLDLIEELQIFSKEVDMYKRLVPNLQLILKEAGLETVFAGRCLHFNEEKLVLAMNDLTVQGYKLANRIIGADLVHTKIVIRKMARFHAASMKYYEKDTRKNIPEYYYKGAICHIEDDKRRENINEFFGRTIITRKFAELAQVLSKIPGYERDAQLVTNLIDYAFDILKDTYTFKSGNILNAHLHGDCWINNMMFKYDESGKPLDVILLDWQISYINSVTNEFMYYFLSSVDDEVREHHFDEIVNFYFENLIETLNTVGYKGIKPSLQQIQEGMIASSSIFILVLGMLLPVIKAKMNEATDRSKAESFSFEEVTQISETYLSQPALKKTLLISMDLLRNIGALEYHEKLLESYRK